MLLNVDKTDSFVVHQRLHYSRGKLNTLVGFSSEPEDEMLNHRLVEMSRYHYLLATSIIPVNIEVSPLCF